LIHLVVPLIPTLSLSILPLLSRFIRGANILEEIKKQKYFGEHVVNSIMFQLLSAVAYCHSKGICHRDIKAEHILVSSSETEPLKIKLVEFKSASTFTSRNKITEQITTEWYMAPEMGRGIYDEKCDVWNCGIFMSSIMCKESPFVGITDNAVLQHVCKHRNFFDCILILLISSQMEICLS
jgi:calcium-dependent protein kinase